MTMLENKYLFRSLFILNRIYNESNNAYIFTLIGEPEKLTLDIFLKDLYSKDSLLKPYENGYIELLNASYDANMAEIPLQIFDIEYPAEDGIFANLSIRVTPDFDDLAAMKLWIELNSDK